MVKKSLGNVFLEHWKKQKKINSKTKNERLICPCGCGKTLKQLYQEYKEQFDNLDNDDECVYND